MDIGLKLDVGFADDEACRRLYGDRDILPYLRALGVTAVETALRPGTDAQALSAYVGACVGAGMKISFHPYSEGTVFNAASFASEGDNPCRKLHQHFFALAAEAAQRQGVATLVNIHAAAGPAGASRRELLERSVLFFTWARDWCARHARDVTVLTELQFRPHVGEPIQRIADDYDEVLEIVTRCNIPACWDFGHAFKNAQRYDMSLYPPETLLKHVAHVHCHDARGRDHQPLIHDNVPWRDFIELLVRNGFDGRVILEVPAWDFLQTGGIQTLTASVQALQSWIRHCRSAS